jgi:two-component system CheB/CheR fusion protein
LEVVALDEPLWVYGDVTRLAQVVGNLLHNAVKYSEPGAPIRISTERGGDNAILRVRDWGSGIDPSHVHRIFDLFYQSDKSLERSRGGLGVGLTLVRQIIEMHGGRVAAYSEGPGRGSEFVVTLHAVEPAEESTRLRVSEAAAVSPGLVRVLVVDDNEDAVETLCVFLEMAGYNPTRALSGTEAMEVASVLKPHVILLDIGLPGMNGYEVAAWMRKQPELSHSRLIALTGYGQPEDRRRCEEAGFDLHFIKPVDLERLESSIRALLGP